MKRQPTPPEIVTLVSGLVILIGGFLPIFDLFDDPNVFGDIAFPTITYVWLIGIALAVLVGLPLVTDVKLPESIIGFSMPQFRLMLAIFAVLIMVGWLITSSGPDTGSGFILMLIGAIGLLASEIWSRQQSSV